eukprot:6490528-Amphidinium_carterae.1
MDIRLHLPVLRTNFVEYSVGMAHIGWTTTTRQALNLDLLHMNMVPDYRVRNEPTEQLQGALRRATSQSSAEVELAALSVGLLEAQQLKRFVLEVLEQASMGQSKVDVTAIALRSGPVWDKPKGEAPSHQTSTQSRIPPRVTDMLKKAATLETLQRLRPGLGLTVFNKPGTPEVGAVSTTSCRKKDHNPRLRGPRAQYDGGSGRQYVSHQFGSA